MGLLDFITNPVGSVAQGAMGLVGTAIASHQARKSQQETNRANAELVEKQNEFNEAMWNKNNEYNSLASQKNRALQAGFNPAILSGQNSVPANPVVQQGIAHQQSNAQTIMAGNQQALSAMDLFNTALVKGQQAKNLKADGKLKEVKTDTELLEQKYIPELRAGQIATQNMQIKLGESQTNLTDQQIKESAQKVLQIQKDMELVDQKIAESVQTIANMKVDERIKLIIERFQAPEMQARIAQLASAANLSNTQARDILATQVARIAELESSTELNRKLGIKADAEKDVYEKTGIRMSYENKMLKVDADIKEKHTTLNEIDRYLQTVKLGTGIIGDVVGGIAKGAATYLGAKKILGSSSSESLPPGSYVVPTAGY